MSVPTTDLEYVLNGTIGKGNHLGDRARLALVLAGARQKGRHREAMEVAKHNRRIWLDWLTMNQRKWQSKARRISAGALARKTALQNFGVYKERGTAEAVARKCLAEAIEARELTIRGRA